MIPRPLVVWCASCLLAISAAGAAAAGSLAERLGYKATDRLLIVNGDDAGMSHGANLATIEAMERGLMRSATIMVPCPWFPEIADYAARNPGRDFGVHLTHTSEWKSYRWGPVAPAGLVPGLLDPHGYLWGSVPQVYAAANPEQALTEGRAQVARALAAGVDVTHLDSHMGTLQLDPRYVEAYLQLAAEFRLPVRMASQATLEKFGQAGTRERFARKGIAFPDHFVYEELKGEEGGVPAFWKGVVRSLEPGLTELYIHAAQPTEEMKAITSSWKTRSEEAETFTSDPEMRRLLEDRGVILIGYRPLRELQRAPPP